MKRIVVTGAGGQVGSELVPELRRRYGDEAVLATDIRAPSEETDPGLFRIVDCTNGADLDEAVSQHGADAIYHLAAVLSAVGERDPQRAYSLNMGALMTALEVARERGCSLFFPSSIAAFGPSNRTKPTPQDTIQRPTTMYGITKVAGELLGEYYFLRFGVDVRGLRFPGLISHVTPPGGGTTDYAVQIFRGAVETGHYTCFLPSGLSLDMMYMPDAIRASIEVMEADPRRLIHRNAFNITAMRFTPGQLAAEIERHVPGFAISYEIDPVRRSIAESWPRSLDDSAAREEWGWEAKFDLRRMTEDMLRHLAARRS